MKERSEDTGAIRTAVQKLAGTFMKDFVEAYMCTVDTVNNDDNGEPYSCDCTPISGESDAQIPEVLLNADPNDGIKITPSVGSTVWVGVTKYGSACVLCYSDIDKLKVIIANTTFEIEDGTITFNGGSLDGLVKVNDIVDRLNLIEKKVNALVSYSASHTHTGVQTGSGVSGTASTPVTGDLVETTKADIENTAILQ